MARTFIVFSEEEPNVGGTTIRGRLDNAWVYWKDGGTFQVLRVDSQGKSFAFTDGNRDRQDGYRTRFVTESGRNVEVAYSLGAKPLARALVDPMLTPRTVPTSLIDLDEGITATEDGVVNARKPLLGEVRLPRVRIGVTTPAREPSLIIALWENLNDPDDAYYTNGIPQRAAWFAQNPQPEHQASAAPAVAVRPRVRGIPIAGFVPEAATGANLKLRDAAGNAIRLLQNGHDPASPQVDQLPLTLQAAQNKQRAFTATLFLPPEAALGPLQILIEPTGLPTPMVGGFFYQLVGAQLAIVDDFDTDPGGAREGPQRAAADEVNVVDYLNSPEMVAGPDTPANRGVVRTALTNHGRARRMVRYAIRNHHPKTIPFAVVVQPPMPAGQGQVLATQMPFWIAELQLVGLNRTQLEDLLVRDATAATPGSGRLELGIDWAIAISWDTPDRADPRNPIIQPRHRVTQAQTVTLQLTNEADAFARKLQNVQNGVATGAIQPAPQRIPFPVAGRRLPAVRIADAGAALQRTWGRHGGAERDSLVVEWQPIYSSDGTINGTPFFRGGDGLLSVPALRVNGQPVDPGQVFPRPTPTPPPAAVAGPANLDLPRFRVHGINLTPAEVGDMASVITEQTYRANIAASPWLSFVSLAVWQATARLIVGHETASHQFAAPGGFAQVGRITIPLRGVIFCHGKERDMPTFGAPHGYGVGQLDPPGNIDRLWDLEANVIESIRRLLIDSGRRAQGDLGLGNNAAALTQKERAVFHRAAVRRYNGGTEFVRNAANTDWMIRPSVRNEPNIYYPDAVLRTPQVRYQDLISAPNEREPRPANHPPIANQVDFPVASFFPGI